MVCMLLVFPQQVVPVISSEKGSADEDQKLKTPNGGETRTKQMNAVGRGGTHKQGTIMTPPAPTEEPPRMKPVSRKPTVIKTAPSEQSLPPIGHAAAMEGIGPDSLPTFNEFHAMLSESGEGLKARQGK